eukprot:CAMPEP_0117575828 /NCGR_PEP_ID=MMETSP0784-20121206/62441_1 /TAXON_ID=39447 /ORGANISM="" /LENGTH=180 /DNA_ID=CAMNT_0005374977 /DNA_START=14 /DNA_END=553 /DNA_ORIENTATION=-
MVPLAAAPGVVGGPHMGPCAALNAAVPGGAYPHAAGQVQWSSLTSKVGQALTQAAAAQTGPAHAATAARSQRSPPPVGGAGSPLAGGMRSAPPRRAATFNVEVVSNAWPQDDDRVISPTMAFRGASIEASAPVGKDMPASPYRGRSFQNSVDDQHGLHPFLEQELTQAMNADGPRLAERL